MDINLGDTTYTKEQLRFLAEHYSGNDKKEEAAIMSELLQEDVFIRADLNGDGSLSPLEHKKIAAVDGNDKFISMKDVKGFQSNDVYQMFRNYSNGESETQGTAAFYFDKYLENEGLRNTLTLESQGILKALIDDKKAFEALTLRGTPGVFDRSDLALMSQYLEPVNGRKVFTSTSLQKMKKDFVANLAKTVLARFAYERAFYDVEKGQYKNDTDRSSYRDLKISSQDAYYLARWLEGKKFAGGKEIDPIKDHFGQGDVFSNMVRLRSYLLRLDEKTKAELSSVFSAFSEMIGQTTDDNTEITIEKLNQIELLDSSPGISHKDIELEILRTSEDEVDKPIDLDLNNHDGLTRDF